MSKKNIFILIIIFSIFFQSVYAQNKTFIPIYEIQGSGSTSPYNGQNVDIECIVTAIFYEENQLNGFFVKDIVGDNNPQTSDGLFIYYPQVTNINAGDKLQISGTVTEYNFLTELTSIISITTTATGIEVVPVDVDIDENTNLEAFESMYIHIPEVLSVFNLNNIVEKGQITLNEGGRLFQPTNEFPPLSNEAIALNNYNQQRFKFVLDDGSSLQNPQPNNYIGTDYAVRIGQQIADLAGVFFQDNNFVFHPTFLPVFYDNPRSIFAGEVGGNLKVASFNVLNYFTTFGSRGADNQEEFDRQRAKIINAIYTLNADVVGLMEIENNAEAILDLVAGINNLAGENLYTADGLGDISGDLIRNGFIYKHSVLQPLGQPVLDDNWINNRQTVAQTFKLIENQKVFTLFVNHFKAKSCGSASGADADQGDGQGCYNYRRTQQAQRLLSFINQMKHESGFDEVIIVGDLNSHTQEDPLNTLTSNGLVNEISRFIPNEYSYVYDGLAGCLDHALCSQSLSLQVENVKQWHINADETYMLDYNLENKPVDYYAEIPFRSSDHDPVLVGINLQSNIVVNTTSASIYDVQYTTDPSGNSPYSGETVQIVGTVTATASNGYFIQENAAMWNGIFVYDTSNTPQPANRIEITGQIDEYYNLTEIKNITEFNIINETATMPEAQTITIAQVDESWESVLVRINNVYCSNANLGYGEWEISDGNSTLVVDDQLFAYSPDLGTEYSITGIITYSYGAFKLLPRNLNDISIVTNLLFEDLSNKTIQIFPNPANHTINIISEIYIDKIEIISIQGEIVISQSYTKSIDISNIPNALYILKIYSKTITKNVTFSKTW